MKKSALFLAAASLFAAAAHAEEPASPFSANIGATTDYRYRGISQTRLQPAVQGGLDYASASGFYIGTWLSTIKWIKDTGRAAGVDAGNAQVEWDIYGGYKGEIAKDFSYDVGVLTYIYPGNKFKDITGANANTTEVYGALTYGPATVKYSHAVTNLFGFNDSKNSGYIEGAATFDVGGGFSLTPHIGYQKVRGFSPANYTDYSLTGSKEFYGIAVSLALVGTSTKTINGADAYASPVNGKNLGRAGVVLAIKKTF
jgi:uncharacterized protein (TIGR02001 family)